MKYAQGPLREGICAWHMKGGIGQEGPVGPGLEFLTQLTIAVACVYSFGFFAR